MEKLLIFLYIATYFSYVYTSGEFTILHHPSTIEFKGDDLIEESDLEEVFSVSLGFTAEHCSSWSGMYLTSPFDLAQAVIVFSVDGITELGGEKGHTFPLKTNLNDVDTFNAMKHRITLRNPSGDSQIANIDLSASFEAIKENTFLHGIKPVKTVKGTHYFLKPIIDEDRKFLQEVNFLKAIADKVRGGILKAGSTPDFYMFRSLALHAVSDLHGENSTVTKEAKQILRDVIDDLKEAFVSVYQGRVLVGIVTSDVSHTRRTRSVTQMEAKKEVVNLNLAKTYSKDYPVIFNIMLWFGVAMVFALLAICITIGSMDPGRDSIIYRMTSTRMKKDN